MGWPTLPRANKYRAIRTTIDGITFDSRKEARRYAELMLRKQAGEIDNLALQPEYPIHAIDGVQVAKYVADFWYIDAASGEIVTEDVKSSATATPLYKLKKKLVEREHRITIVEV